VITIYTDAAFDQETGLGCYCLIIVSGSFKDYAVENIDGCTNSTDAEYAGIEAAIEIISKTNKVGRILCDSMGAIKKAQGLMSLAPRNYTIEHFKGHQLGSMDVEITDDVKRHHWADSMARAELRRRLDAEKQKRIILR